MATFSLCVKSGPHTPGSRHGLEFSKACIAQGHRILRVFFYGDGVYLSLNTQVMPQDEVSLSTLWQEFLIEHKIDAVVCIAAALRRGVVDETEANRKGLKLNLIHSGFELSGLGQWITANNEADFALSFG